MVIVAAFPKDTTRAEAFEMWMTLPMPMVTLIKTFDVSRLLKASKKMGVKFNALLVDTVKNEYLCYIKIDDYAQTQCNRPGI